LYPVLRARAQAWVALSEHDRASLAAGFGVSPNEVTVIRNGIAPLDEAPPAADRGEVRRALGLPEDAYLALSVGRLSRQKAHADLIPAAARALERFPQTHFAVAGEGEERGELERMIRDQGLEATVHLVGNRDDVDRLLSAADLFVFPSHWEGSPFALLEAAARGLPVISADFGGASEIVTDRHSGLLHPVGDTDALWGALEFAVEHPTETRAMGERLRQETANRFSHEEMIGSMLALLGEHASSAG
jgi:glycosyltransferase involved in cell wall biosynthesis